MKRRLVVIAVLAVGCADAALESTPGPDGAPADDPDAAALDAKPTADANPAPDAESPLDWDRVDVNVPDGLLCDIPADYLDLGGDPTYVPCDLEADRFSDVDPEAAPDQLRIVTWNIRFGIESANVLDALRTHAELSSADVLFLQEVPRHDLSSEPAGINEARDLAQALAMDYVFAVEWDRRLNEDQGGEHGVAILSKYPIGNVTQIRHVPLNDWYAEDSRYGGRMTLGADLLVGGRRYRVYASHLDTRPTLPDDSGRAEQGAEIRADADDPSHPTFQIVGGDLNTWTCNPLIADCTSAPAAEAVVENFLGDGWADGTAGFTGVTHLGIGFFPQRLDWLFYRGGDATPGTAVDDAGASDHFPVYFDIEL